MGAIGRPENEPIADWAPQTLSRPPSRTFWEAPCLKEGSIVLKAGKEILEPE